jgi:hypothetical protein
MPPSIVMESLDVAVTAPMGRTAGAFAVWANALDALSVMQARVAVAARFAVAEAWNLMCRPLLRMV